MTTRLHVVNDRASDRRRKSASTSPFLKLQRHTISAGLQNTVAAEWQPRTFGEYNEAWLPSVRASPETRLSYIVAIASSYLTRISGGMWDCHLDFNEAPRALVLTSTDDADVIPLSVDGRSARVGHVPVCMSKVGVSGRLVELLAPRVGVWFGTDR